MSYTTNPWTEKNATLSSQNAAKEYGISYEEILDAINAGEFQFRESSMHGNPWFRLLRTEVEAYVQKKYGTDYLKERKTKKELSEIKKKLKALKAEIAILEQRKTELLGPQ